MKLKSLALIVLFTILFVACQNRQKQIQPTKLSKKIDTLTYRLYQVDSGWGYDILLNQKVIIHQPIIPAVQGRFPFRTKEDARKVAKLVIYKLLTKPGLPTVSVRELDSLGVLYDAVKEYQRKFATH